MNDPSVSAAWFMYTQPKEANKHGGAVILTWLIQDLQFLLAEFSLIRQKEEQMRTALKLSLFQVLVIYVYILASSDAGGWI